MSFLNSYVIVLGWVFVIALTSAVAFAISIWLVDRMVVDTKALRGVMKKPLAAAILLAAVVLGISIVISSVL